MKVTQEGKLRATPSRMHPILEELAAVVAASLKRNPGLAPHAAAEHVIDALRAHYGGSSRLYIPSGKFTVEWMREQIARRWTGRNTRDLAREFEITENRVRQLGPLVAPHQNSPENALLRGREPALLAEVPISRIS